MQSACLTCRCHKEKSTRFESSKWDLSNSSEATCLKRLCGDANRLAISRNDSVVPDRSNVCGSPTAVLLVEGLFRGKIYAFLRERHQRHDASSKSSFVWHLASAGQRESQRGCRQHTPAGSHHRHCGTEVLRSPKQWDCTPNSLHACLLAVQENKQLQTSTIVVSHNHINRFSDV